MPVLEDVRQTKEIELPKTKGKVVVYDSLVYGDVYKMQEMESDAEKQIVTALALVKDWDFTDKENNKLPINKENFLKLPIEDVTALVQHIGTLDIDKKKESPSKK